MKRTIAAVALVLAILAVGYWGMASTFLLFYFHFGFLPQPASVASRLSFHTFQLCSVSLASPFCSRSSFSSPSSAVFSSSSACCSSLALFNGMPMGTRILA